MTAAYPLLRLWQACQLDDDNAADRLIAQAAAEGATEQQIAVARRERADRIASQVHTFGDVA